MKHWFKILLKKLALRPLLCSTVIFCFFTLIMISCAGGVVGEARARAGAKMKARSGQVRNFTARVIAEARDFAKQFDCYIFARGSGGGKISCAAVGPVLT